MILEDAKALAISKGEVTEADAANWTIEDALGSKPNHLLEGVRLS